MSDASLDVEEISNWQLWVAPTTTCWKTGLVCVSHWSDWLVGALVVTVQVPGPRRGTSTTSKPGPSVPENSPFIALGLGAALIRRTVVVVTTEELSATDGVVIGVVVAVGRWCVTRWWCVGDVVVVEFGVAKVVVTGDVKEGGRDEAAGPLGVVPDVRVKTRTRSSTGLDHIRR